MVLLGLALVLVAALATGFVVLASNVGHATVALSAYNISLGVTPTTVFVAGAVSLLLLVVGLTLLRRGIARKARERRELRRLRKQQGAATPPGTGRDYPSTGASSGSGPSSGTGTSTG